MSGGGGFGAKLLLLGVILAAVASTATAAVIQTEGLRITVLGQVLPFKLPRDRVAPVAVFISGHVDTPDDSTPPQLQKMVIRVSRHGQLRPQGIPTCRIKQIQPGTTTRALANCGDAIVGSGRFWASVVLPEQRPYRTRGRLLVFNGRRDGHPVLFAHIFTTQPFNTSFVITFGIERVREAQFATRLTADFPRALGTWGFVDRIKLTLRRKITGHGRQRSYFNASCPAPVGSRVGSFLLAKAGFFFAEKRPISLDVVKVCGVKE